MAKIICTGGYPPPAAAPVTQTTVTSSDTHPSDRAKPHLGGGGG
jgi:hypothetical protein